jgi:hypothetical protein
MATKFMTLDGQKSEKKETVFTHYVNGNMDIIEATLNPKNYENVLHIGYDNFYKDVFKVWNNKENEFKIYFGKKGDEF